MPKTPKSLVEIADNVQVKVLKATLSEVRAKGQPVEAKELTDMLQVSHLGAHRHRSDRAAPAF